MSKKTFFGLISVVFLLDLLTILFFSQNLAFQSGFTSSNPLANFDGVHYLRIAFQGYSETDYSFFPLYPLLIRILSAFFNAAISGILISVSCFLASIILFKKLLIKIGLDKYSDWIILFLIAFPTSFFFYSVYSESLFLLLVILFYLHSATPSGFIPGLLSSLTRFVGVFSSLPLIISTKRSIWAFISPFLGFLIYCLYLFLKTGDPLKFLHVVSVYGAQRSGTFVLLPQVLFRYFRILTTSSINYQYAVAFLELGVFLIFLAILLVQFWSLFKKDSHPLLKSLILFSIINLLVPTLSGSLSSIPRYSLLSISFFIFIGTIEKPVWKWSILIAFLVLRVALLSLFTRGYFIS